MAQNTSPIFIKDANLSSAPVSAANTASDGSGTLVTLWTAGLNGSLLFRVTGRNAQVTAAASSAMVARLFLTDTSGNNPRLFREVAIATATRSVSAIGASFNISFGLGVYVASGQILKVAQSVYAGAQDLMHYFAEGGDY